MKITDAQLTKITQMMESESEIIDWIDSQKNAQDIYDWFNEFMQGYVVKKA
jgi:hypothetical protein